jgi:hypothetical protein
MGAFRQRFAGKEDKYVDDDEGEEESNDHDNVNVQTEVDSETIVVVDAPRVFRPM